MEEEGGCWEEQQVASMYMDECSPDRTCLKGHRRSLAMETAGGGIICLPCFAALASDPHCPTHHLSYALSQLQIALEDPSILLDLRERHAYLLVAPLVTVLWAFDDEALARQVMELISDLCFRKGTGRLGLGGRCYGSTATSLSGDFISRIADRLASGALEWSRRQIYVLHCFGELLNSHQGSSPAAHIRGQSALFSNLFVGLQLPSEELRGEILFVIYKLCSLDITPWKNVVDDDYDCAESLDIGATALLRLALEILHKTQHDEVRLNCLALLLVLVGKPPFQNLFVCSLHGIDLKETNDYRDELIQHNPLITLFADAVKGSLLSSDEEIQINALDLIFYMISENFSTKQLQVLVEENIPDYIFEILRLSGNKDPVVISCLQVLALFSNVEEFFKQNLVLGFSTLLFVLHYTSQIPMHPVQPQVLTLVCKIISNFPGIMSISQVEEIAIILTCLIRRCVEHPETFTLACSAFVEIIKLPSAYGDQNIGSLIKEASTCAITYSLSFSQENPTAIIMQSLLLLKEAHAYSRREDGNANSDKELEENIIVTCQNNLLPWLERVIYEEVEEVVIHEVLQTFHLVLVNGSDIQSHIFAKNLISSSMLTLCFTFIGLFPTDQMRSSIYIIISSLIDRAFGPSFGQPIRDAFLYLPLDPLDLIILLGQKSSVDPQLALCQRATLLLLYVISLSGERLADDSQVLASLDQYILINSNNFSCGNEDSLMLTQVVHLYGLFRGSPVGESMAYSQEAEKTLLNLLAKYNLELFLIDIHPTALKWFFQQEEIMASLSNQLLKFCRFSEDLVVNSHRHAINMQLISELVVSGDNYVAPLLVSLLKELQEDEENDLICVLKTMEGMIKKFRDTSIQFCFHNFAGSIRKIYYSPYCSKQLFAACSLLVFQVLYTANHNVITQQGEWLAITMKLLELINPKLASQSLDQVYFLVLGIFCLILHHSKNQVLEEASRAILLNAHMASAIDNIIQAASKMGPALVDHSEETVTYRHLIFALLLNLFSLNCLCATNIQECLDWQDLLQSSDPTPQQSVVSIKCLDLCRLLHFGSSPVKLLSSQCMVDILSRISQQIQKKHEQLNCPAKYLQSMIAIMEGLVFYEDRIVATNCSISLSTILSWANMYNLHQKFVVNNSKWLRIIMEEFAMTLTAPCMASKCFKNRHKPASHIATALLSLDETPEWMILLFDSSSLSGILSNLCSQNLSVEMVTLFRSLLSRNYLNDEHIECLNQIYQVRRKQVYKESSKGKPHQSLLDNRLISDASDFDTLSSLLIRLVLPPAHLQTETEHERLLKEIDLFYRELSAQNQPSLFDTGQPMHEDANPGRQPG